MSKYTCETCRFFDQIPMEHMAKTLSVCRRYPPSKMAQLDADCLVDVPLVMPDEWCGEYQPRADKFAEDVKATARPLACPGCGTTSDVHAVACDIGRLLERGKVEPICPICKAWPSGHTRECPVVAPKPETAQRS